ncbi:SNF5-domain-containing protein [Dichomitus squalens LYAD-421 SS1]|uniref:SNF5-domain-containing protein n=1 Tax=Dichomitus squalens (strain LYAD-421) TaxID=732165 RepID=UPI00044157F3|nr:SNF5-domain-containing protein [Dichomitus squalens LYAD-421 SS1]EJF64964.1 SNF5-domain-containing protein [Dichomitus squalens LYAD-421 SS1]
MATPQHGSRNPLSTATQALHSTYASRLRTGTTLLVQPILAPSSIAAVATRTTRRGGVVNYADPGSGDEFPDAGAVDSDDSDFGGGGGGGGRQGGRSTRLPSRAPAGSSVFDAGRGAGSGHATPVQAQQSNELDRSYLGEIPPARFITARPLLPTRLEYYSQAALETQAEKPTALIPIRVEFETDSQRIRDCFVWNMNEELITPEIFARTFCTDLDLPLQPYVEIVANQMRAQIEEHEGVASMYLGADAEVSEEEDESPGDEVSECRVILSIDVQIATHHLLDHIEWDLLSPLTPEEFSVKLCRELGLTGEAAPLIAHAIHEEILKHKRDAIEWGVIGGETRDAADDAGADKPRDKSGLSLMKDKTGLGLGWGRAPKDGRGPKPLRSVWRDWQEAEEFRTRFEVLTAEEVERRELERERASRRLRRETSKFQSTARSRLLTGRR